LGISNGYSVRDRRPTKIADALFHLKLIPKKLDVSEAKRPFQRNDKESGSAVSARFNNQEIRLVLSGCSRAGGTPVPGEQQNYLIPPEPLLA